MNIIKFDEFKLNEYNIDFGNKKQNIAEELALSITNSFDDDISNEDELNECIKSIQETLGITDGGLGTEFFSDKELGLMISPNDKMNLFLDYIKEEIRFAAIQGK
jgi:hypothetical protein